MPRPSIKKKTRTKNAIDANKNNQAVVSSSELSGAPSGIYIYNNNYYYYRCNNYIYYNYYNYYYYFYIYNIYYYYLFNNNSSSNQHSSQHCFIARS